MTDEALKDAQAKLTIMGLQMESLQQQHAELKIEIIKEMRARQELAAKVKNDGKSPAPKAIEQGEAARPVPGEVTAKERDQLRAWCADKEVKKKKA